LLVLVVDPLDEEDEDVDPLDEPDDEVELVELVPDELDRRPLRPEIELTLILILRAIQPALERFSPLSRNTRRRA
jgi:hypothetical protein